MDPNVKDYKGLPCKNCITLAICKGIVQKIYDREEDRAPYTPYDKKDPMIIGAPVAHVIKHMVIDKLCDKCSLLKKYVKMLIKPKMIIIERYPAETGYTINEFAAQQLLEYFGVTYEPNYNPKVVLKVEKTAFGARMHTEIEYIDEV